VTVFAGVVLAAVVAAAGSVIAGTLWLGSPPMPTGPAVTRTVVAALPADLNGEVHELGAGWGTLAWAVAEARPAARVIAWEASPLPWAFCRVRTWLQPRANLDIRWGDFRSANLTHARLILCFLSPEQMRDLDRWLFPQLPPGAAVCTHTFACPGRTPAWTRRAGDVYRSPVYWYAGDVARAQLRTVAPELHPSRDG
jgi:hypothetical protein